MESWNTVDWDTAARTGATIGWASQTSTRYHSADWYRATWSFVAALAVAGAGCPPALLDRFCELGGEPELAAQAIQEGLAGGNIPQSFHKFGGKNSWVLNLDLAIMAVTIRFIAAGMTVRQATGWADGPGAVLLRRTVSVPDWSGSIEAPVAAGTLPAKSSWRGAAETETELLAWIRVLGPDSWADVTSWAAAGYTPDETVALLAFPIGHPNRPGPDQLAVMAALRAHT